MPKKRKILGTFSGKSCDSNIFNNNEMHLGRKLFENVLASQEYKDAIERGHYIGFLGHPDDPGCQDFQNACIVMTSMSIDDNGEIYAEFDLVDTPVGRIVKAFIDAGVQFGISIRGAGDVGGDGEVDPDTFCFRGFDLVAFPAYNDCVPEFQEIAASKDLEKQKKYKKVCAAVETNLKSINSCEALEIIKEQLVEGSDPYVQVSERLDELTTSEDLISEESSLQDEKVDALVTMYTEALDTIESLEWENAQLRDDLNAANTSYLDASKKIKVMSRIHASQVQSFEVAVTAAEKKAQEQHNRYVNATKRIQELTAKVSDVEKTNLNYSQKIQSSESLLSQKDREIEKLNSKLRETVAASKELKASASNFDANVSELEAKVQAAEEMVFAYQKAYANLYATALGKNVTNLSVTAATSPEELKKSILGSTSTANIPAKPECSDEYFVKEDEENGLVSV